MAEQCKDIDAALARLEAKINAENQRIRNLENRVGALERGGSKKQGEQKPQDLTEIHRRLAILEKNQEAFKVGIVESLNNFADIENTNKDFALAFQGLYELINPIIESVSSIVKLIKG